MEYHWECRKCGCQFENKEAHGCLNKAEDWIDLRGQNEKVSTDNSSSFRSNG